MGNKQTNKKGFIAMVSLVLLILLAIVGVAYWVASRTTSDMIFSEAMRIKARNYAQAGIEVVKTTIINSCYTKKHDMSYKRGVFSNLSEFAGSYERDFGDGSYRVVSIEPYRRHAVKYMNLKHVVNGIEWGNYDVWDIIVEGTAQPTGVKAEIRALIKVYRDDTVY